MKLPLKERIAPRYLYVNPKTNMVHLLMPIMSGTEIGLDNTCKSVYSLQEFFGLLGANKQSTALGMLEDYKDALAFDLKYCPDSKEKELKAARLLQINTYLSLLKSIQNEKGITESLKKVFPTYPAPLESLMQAKEANLYSVILRPKEQDVQLRTTAITPVFSANHDCLVHGLIVLKDSLLGNTLLDSYKDLAFTPKSKEQLIARVLSKFSGSPVDFEQIRAKLTQEIHDYLGIEVTLSQTQGTRYAPSVPMTQSYLDEQLAIDADNLATHLDYINALLEYCTPNLFESLEGSPFYMMNEAERLSILTQFFLAELNIACRTQGVTNADWGQILEANFELISHLAQTVQHALERSFSVEEALIDYMNRHQDVFQLKSPIPKDNIPKLKERFKSHYELIKDSPHFDEFMLLSEKKGLFVTHQGCIVTHFAHFLQTSFSNEVLDEPTRAFLQAAQQDFETVDKPDNVIPHKNDFIHADLKEVELDLSKMDNHALQVLYEDINRYEDPKLKKTLLTQFKQERPDFKPKIDARQFLQHVAYGQQDEAEALLQKEDPQLAQELLKADNIAFTDYSGRTFTCTAYEYAYWAKDSHMQRMLEKHIRLDEDTRQFILERVQQIEELVNLPPDAGLFEHPKPRGLHYTTRDEQGNTIDHWETHFDLTPLKRALEHYVKEYNEKPNKSGADWEQLDKIWVEEVGRAQRDVPAHIAQEYCHPDRSFEDVTNNQALLDATNPTNLKRQLKFRKLDTNEYYLWFTPDSYSVDSGLGFSFGILRWRYDCRPREWWAAGAGDIAFAVIDLNALTAIDEVRTSDLKQSLDNLRQPLIVQASQSHST
ncbi:hypothetical protein EP47_09000 [Legionella norrlandica]|uniref:SidC N-terminal domain-containing protein n=1 Tax=Legionella norrlandica TaxID=1498499 RepID=A0A0A2SUF0_9GAMM|nr:hypothetical protein [Legionella norrlandica]KGP63059.1 hypothetical protein EP47_09000 [Legionella norrlandica]